MAVRTWTLFNTDRNGRFYDSGYTFEADGPVKAMYKAGFDPYVDYYRTSRVGTNYYTSKVFVYLPEEIIAAKAAGREPKAEWLIRITKD